MWEEPSRLFWSGWVVNLTEAFPWVKETFFFPTGLILMTSLFFNYRSSGDSLQAPPAAEAASPTAQPSFWPSSSVSSSYFSTCWSYWVTAALWVPCSLQTRKKKSSTITFLCESRNDVYAGKESNVPQEYACSTWLKLIYPSITRGSARDFTEIHHTERAWKLDAHLVPLRRVCS